VKSETPGKSVLLIEDNPGDVRLIREMLADDPAQPFTLTHADRLSAGIEKLSHKPADLVLLDLSLPDSHGIETFSKIYAHSPKVPIIVLSGNDDQQLALYAVKSGAQDYLVKGKIDSALLMKAMQYSIERKRYQEELERQANYDALTGLPNRHLLHDRRLDVERVDVVRVAVAVRHGVQRPRPDTPGHRSKGVVVVPVTMPAAVVPVVVIAVVMVPATLPIVVPIVDVVADPVVLPVVAVDVRDVVDDVGAVVLPIVDDGVVVADVRPIGTVVRSIGPVRSIVAARSPR
jgi:DNA-binding NarL/FixJ family response regulator